MNASRFLAVLFFLIPSMLCAQTTWYVDDDNQPGPGSGTAGDPFVLIQDGIDASVNSDTVLVMPGTYVEGINFSGKAIVVVSDDGPEVTVIDGAFTYDCVTFNNGEGPDSVLKGFTILNTGNDLIECNQASSPTIAGNIITGQGLYAGFGISLYNQSAPVITHNLICGIVSARGINCSDSSPTIIYNVIRDNALGPTGFWVGAGIYCNNGSNPLIANNIIANNSVQTGTIEGVGGGIGIWNSSPIICNNLFKENSASKGAAIACEMGGSLLIINNRFERNVCDGSPINEDGGGIYSESADIEIINNVFLENRARTGSAIRTAGDSTTVIRGNLISRNTTTNGAGSVLISCSYSSPGASPLVEGNTITGNMGGGCCGIYCASGSSIRICKNTISRNKGKGIAYMGPEDAAPVITHNIIADNYSGSAYGAGISITKAPALGLIAHNFITGNSTNGMGGGIYVQSRGLQIYSNCFANNKAGMSGGGIYCGTNVATAMQIESNTFTGNQAVQKGGAVYSDICAVSTVIKNSILWNNQASQGNEIYSDPASPTTPTVTYCDVTGGWPGTGNMDKNPLFAHPLQGDYHLKQAPCEPGCVNPCVDAGDPASAMVYCATRTDGQPDTGMVDMGFHYPRTLLVPVEIPTIQAAITTAMDHDTVRVLPSTYFENIDFGGKAVHVLGIEGAKNTVIDGSQLGSVVTFQSGEGFESILEGFTIRDGFTTLPTGAGIYCTGASPTLLNNFICENEAQVANTGSAIRLTSASPLIQGNRIYGNTTFKGGAIDLNSGCYPEITGNFIYDNKVTDTGSGGIDVGGGDAPVIVNNLFFSNTTAHRGGAIACRRYAIPLIANNTFHDNTADLGGGAVFAAHSLALYNNIFWNNHATVGKEIYIRYYADGPIVLSVACSDLDGGLSSVKLQDGSYLLWDNASMIDANPLFANPAGSDFHLTGHSPCIDSGGRGSLIPDMDFEGDPRQYPAIGTGLYPMGSQRPRGQVDMGADEYCLFKNKPWIPK